MEVRRIEDIIREHPFFKGMKQEYLSTIAGCGSNVHFKAGEVVFRQKDEANQFFLVRGGRIALDIEVADRGMVTILTLGAGDVLGWSWLFPPYVWFFDARALEPTAAIAMDGRCLRGKCEEDPVMGYELMKRFASMIIDRLQAARLQLMDFYGSKEKD